MKLDDYVNDVFKRGGSPSSFPTTLTLSKDFAGDFYRLWEEGERRGIEVGYNMIVKNNACAIDTSKKFDGGPYSIDIPWQDDRANFGDLHSHPANSIGHVQGYSAHSIQDIRAMDKDTTNNKPLFIRFVSSGYYAYAVVFRNGHSAIDSKQLNKIVDQVGGEMQQLFLDKNKMTMDDYVDTQSSFTSAKQSEAWVMDKKKKTPGFGPDVQRLSVAHCTKVARDMKLGFYTGYRGLGGWVAGSELTLDLAS